ncbi:MAG: helix-turn-helix transcriptional regulator [Sciscionella sp.]
MPATSARLLRLLSLLQTRPWTGPELAERLEVTNRTVRNDIDRLRSLGYPIHGNRGSAGGYQLGAGAAMPPLLLDDEEAVAVAIGLSTAVTSSIEGVEEASLRALAKLQQVLPSRLRHRLQALQTFTLSAPRTDRGPLVSADVLTHLVAACRDRERLRFDYERHDGANSRRDVEPYRVVNLGRRWYLVAWDIERIDWRTFRVDRMQPKSPNGPRFTPRALPDQDVATYVARAVGAATWEHRSRIVVHAPAELVAEKLPASAGTLEIINDGTCRLTTGSDNPQMLAVWLTLLGHDFSVEDSPQLVDQLGVVADRYRRAIDSSRANAEQLGAPVR